MISKLCNGIKKCCLAISPNQKGLFRDSKHYTNTLIDFGEKRKVHNLLGPAWLPGGGFRVCWWMEFSRVMDTGVLACMPIELSVINLLVEEVLRLMGLLVELAETEGGVIKIRLYLLQQLFLDESWVRQW
jgi:hypothetical protein